LAKYKKSSSETGVLNSRISEFRAEVQRLSTNTKDVAVLELEKSQLVDQFKVAEEKFKESEENLALQKAELEEAMKLKEEKLNLQKVELENAMKATEDRLRKEKEDLNQSLTAEKAQVVKRTLSATRLLSFPLTLSFGRLRGRVG